MGQDDRVPEPLLHLDRDRGSGPAAAVQERVRLLSDELPQLVDLELSVAVSRRQEPPDGAGDRPHSGTAGGELPPGGDEIREELLARGGRLVGYLDEGLDGAASHPACSMIPVEAQLLDA